MICLLQTWVLLSIEWNSHNFLNKSCLSELRARDFIVSPTYLRIESSDITRKTCEIVERSCVHICEKLEKLTVFCTCFRIMFCGMFEKLWKYKRLGAYSGSLQTSKKERFAYCYCKVLHLRYLRESWLHLWKLLWMARNMKGFFQLNPMDIYLIKVSSEDNNSVRVYCFFVANFG